MTLNKKKIPRFATRRLKWKTGLIMVRKICIQLSSVNEMLPIIFRVGPIRLQIKVWNLTCPQNPKFDIPNLVFYFLIIRKLNWVKICLGITFILFWACVQTVWQSSYHQAVWEVLARFLTCISCLAEYNIMAEQNLMNIFSVVSKKNSMDNKKAWDETAICIKYDVSEVQINRSA